MSVSKRHRLFGLFVLALAFVAPVQARVVALVLDDSGSMRPVFEQAAFAIQLLTAVVDRQDQLYIARLNGEGGRVIGPLNLADRPALLEQIRSAWQAKNKDATHYGPLAATLDTLAQVTPPGARASLLIVSDGAFTDPPPEPALREHFQRIKDHFRGESLDAYFVVLHHRADLRAIIEQQGIRRQVLTLFNGSPDAGRIDIDDPRNVYPGLRQAITLLHGASHERNPDIVEWQSQRLQLRPPFSISRLEVIVPGDPRSPPAEFASASFALAQTPPEAFFPQMRTGNARVYHLRPAQTLQPGERYTLDFTRPLPADAQVLFDSGLAVELHFFDAQDRPLQPDAQRRLQVHRNTPLVARATLVDRLATGGAQAVDFARLSRDPAFTLQEGQRSQAMTVYREKSYAAADLRYAQPGQYTLTVVASYPGFVTRRAQDVTVDVLATQDLALNLNAHRRLDCADCAPNQARLPYTDRADPVEVFAIQAQAEGAPGTGDYILTLEAPLPEGISVRLPNGQALTGTSAQFPLQPGQPATLRLQYDRAYRAAQPVPVQLRLRPVQSLWRGEARVDLRLIPVVGAVDLRAAGHTGPDPQAPLVLPVTALNPGQGMYVQALHLLDPLGLEQLSISSDQAPFALALAGGDRVLVQPRNRWGCDCFTPGGEQSFTLDYRNARTGQQARYQGRVTLTRGPWWAVCWQEALAALAVLAVIIKLICLWRTQRFPVNSRVVVTEQDQQGVPRRLPLHRLSATLFTCWSEQRKVAGLVLRATPQGAEILYQRNLSPTLMHLMRGESLVDLYNQNSRRPVNWRWNEALEDSELRRTYVLVKHSGQWKPGD